MPRFKQIYDRWYSAAPITRGINKGKRWNSTPSIESQGLLPFEEEINYIETNGDSDILDGLVGICRWYSKNSRNGTNKGDYEPRRGTKTA